MTQLFCLPHAGGSARVLARTLAPHLSSVHPTALELPGRGDRPAEPAHREWAPAVADLAERLLAATDGHPYGLLGHSMGAVLAFEITHRLRELGAPQPVLLTIVARNPPHRPPERHPMLDAGSDEELFAAVVELGGVSPRAAGPLVYRTFLPTLRADLHLAAAYVPRTDRPRLTAELLVLQGTGDALTCPRSMPGWGRVCTSRPRLHTLPGDHFFVMHHAAAVAALVESALAGHA